jgi:hypothetical protein
MKYIPIISGFILPFILAWCFGINLSERGLVLGTIVILGFYCAVMGYYFSREAGQ